MSKSTAGQMFKQARLKKGLTQIDIAKKAEIHPNTYAKIERGIQEPSFATIKKLCKVLDLNIADIPA
jgi:transcriptional regulator with XRE-family HTH domain